MIDTLNSVWHKETNGLNRLNLQVYKIYLTNHLGVSNQKLERKIREHRKKSG